MTVPIDCETWVAMAARCARRGWTLMRSEGASVVVVVLDLAGKPHRVDRIEDLEGLLMGDAA